MSSPPSVDCVVRIAYFVGWRGFSEEVPVSSFQPANPPVHCPVRFAPGLIRPGLRERGERARLIYVADTYDPLRKVYPFLPKEYEAHVGKPLSEIPDPEGR